jgi:hypothetical protein
MLDNAEFEQDETEGRNPVRDRMKQLEAENQKYRAEAAEAVAAKRELAFIKVGIDVDSPTGKLFAKAYDGETSPEAVAAAAAEYGLIKPPSRVNADEQEQRAWSSASMSQASGAPAPAAGDIRDAMRNARNPLELQALIRQFQASQ